MYLKEIEIVGFKSFADKININLDNNITCVVGPNGSGKSNIVDAIRWVLGEQSVKSLRGENNMTDIIFSGSKSRNPLNAASVALTFDNSDNYLNLPYNNVSIKRRSYRSGENEYFLNGEKCRLKDITELFLDTGVGKSSFNIVSQGDISKILSNSSQERRGVIEEAAGILKYKSRREEALRKLDRTNDNILRVNDIISELSNRVEPLKEQSIKAKEYLEVKENLKQVEIGLLVDEITEFNGTYQESKRKIEILNKDILSLNTKLSSSKLEEEKLKSLACEKKINELSNQLLLLTKEEEELNSERQIIRERSKYDAKDVKVHENIILLKEKELSLENDISLQKEELVKIDEEIVNLKDDFNNEVNQLSDLKVKQDNENREYNVKNKEYQETLNRVNIIKDNLENNTLLNSNVRKILNNPRLRGINDVFGNIISTDSMYSMALEVCIMGSKNFVIVEDTSSAKDAINFLKDNKLGRATFFPLDVIKPKGIDYEVEMLLEKQKDYLGTMASFVRFDEKYKDVVYNQLGNILVCQNIDSGNQISKMINNRYKIVTLDGEMIHVGGSITGGSVNTTTSPISLKNELNTLIVKSNNLKNILDDLTRDMNNLNNLIIDKEELVYQKRMSVMHEEEKKTNILKNLENNQQEYQRVKLELNNLTNLDGNTLTQQEEEANLKYYEKKKEKELLEKELMKEKNNHEKLNAFIFNQEGEIRLINSELREKEHELKELEILTNKLDTKLDNNLEILNNEYEMTYERAKNEFILDYTMEEARSLVNKYKSKLKEIGMVNLMAIDEYEEVNQRYVFLTSQRDDLSNAKETLLSIIDEMDTIMQEDFLKTFNILQAEFQNVFQMLFKGGTATLKLTEPDNLLETGVDIIASPPGKSLKAISLLSGGEKTLTAISLLFAILNIRKVPFCIFDEIEAALDENNVDIFGHYLDNYKNKTQFLLITHKKRTMEYAKTLYGITMQESGVSKLVSVKLES